LKHSLALIALVLAAFAQPALAQKDDKPGRGGGPDKATHGKGNDNAPGQGQGQGQGARGNQTAAPGNIVVADHDRNAVYTYYRNDFAAGNCPPGLAKKNNGCLPPGQVNRAWVIGQPLPPQIVYEPMPRALWTQLTPPPYGYEYVRVADDIVLMSTATRVIAGLLGNLGSFSD
jgi:Ni/Co efflux regulator RcnB